VTSAVPRSIGTSGCWRRRRQRLEKYVGKLSVRVGDELSARWAEVPIAELGAEELAGDCLGSDLLHPSARETLVRCKERLLDVKAGLAPLVEVELGEPGTDDVTRLVRPLLQEARR